MMPVPYDVTPNPDALDALRLGDGEVLLALDDEVCLRGSAPDILRWGMRIVMEVSPYITQQEMADFMLTSMTDLAADMALGRNPFPDDPSGL